MSFKSSNFLILYCVEWIPELISKACWKNWLELLDLRILVLFSLKQDYVCCEFSFKGMLSGLSRDIQTKVLRVLWTILSDFLAKSALQKAFKNFMKFKASFPVPILFRWSPHFPRHDTSMFYQFYQHQILLIIYSKYFKVSVAFPLSVLQTGWEIIILRSELLILIYDISL